MSNQRKVYIVRGQHDGNIGVYSNIKRAFEKAIEYTGENSIMSYVKNDNIIYKSATYNRVIKEFKHLYSVSLFDNEEQECEVEMEVFYLNE